MCVEQYSCVQFTLDMLTFAMVAALKETASGVDDDDDDA